MCWGSTEGHVDVVNHELTVYDFFFHAVLDIRYWNPTASWIQERQFLTSGMTEDSGTGF